MGAIKGQRRFTRMVQLAEIIFALLFPDWTVVLLLLMMGLDLVPTLIFPGQREDFDHRCEAPRLCYDGWFNNISRHRWFSRLAEQRWQHGDIDSGPPRLVIPFAGGCDHSNAVYYP